MYAIFIFLLLNFLIKSYAKYSVGVIDTAENWAYMERFCFVSQTSQLSFTLQYPVKYEIETLYLYYDTADQWDAAYNGSLVSPKYTGSV
uniref:GPR180-like N-terminal domain-containing protein n=1 Tax=Acrobeloides nanus TaxID=290746 RepID=A0A914DC13_9BILA